ncbi:hypothetical protein [Natrinema sp. H-ect4]|uniref:hypothetical protein n=1 Tax=Natrinema sp. H-ect4 TaxID=3242699 RepID=UPI0035A82158
MNDEMSDIRVVGASVTLAFLLAGVVSAITESPAVLGVTPVGIAIYSNNYNYLHTDRTAVVRSGVH